jgi:hypothetical protein
MRIPSLRLPRRSARAGFPTTQTVSPEAPSVTSVHGPEPPDCPPGWTIGPPDFVIFGAAKSGTTRWRRLLNIHPDVYIPSYEIRYWDKFVKRWPTPADIERYHRQFPRPPGGIAGDKSPVYLGVYWAASMLSEAAPAAKVIVILRDPVERYRSARTFDERLREERVKAGMPDASFTRTIVDESFLRGLYSQQLTWLFQSFPRDQVQVLQFEACIQDAQEQLRRTHRFLGLSDVLPPASAFEAEVNASKSTKVTIEPERLEVMRRLFEHDVQTLRGIVPELDLSLWPNFAHLAAVEPGVAPAEEGRA